MKVFCVLVFLLSAPMLVAQFSQIERFYPFAFPNITNPANTGVFLQERPSNFARIQSNSQIEHENTWSDFYTTLNLDYRVPVFRLDHIGLGFDYKLRKSLSDPFYENSYQIRASYQKGFGRRSDDFLSIGINVGVKEINPAIYRVWIYQQDHGLSWLRRSSRSSYQVGLIHKMQFVLDDSSDPTFSPSTQANWQHWAALQVYGEWDLSRRVELNFLLNYQYRFYGGGNFAQNLLGGTIATAYKLGKRPNAQKLMFGAGLQWIGVDVNHPIPLTYNFFLAYEHNKFRIMAHFSFRYDDNHRVTNRTQVAHQLGLSFAYHIFRIRRMGGVPDW